MINKSDWVKVVKVGEEQVLFYIEHGNEEGHGVMHQLVMAPDNWTLDLSVRHVPIDDLHALLKSVNKKVASMAIQHAKSIYNEQVNPTAGVIAADEYDDV